MAVRQDTILGAVDIADIITLRDPVTAEVTLVGTIANRHHDMMAGWGRPDNARGMYYVATGTATIVIPCRVPPGVEVMDLSLLLYGEGTIKATCATDGTGGLLTSSALPATAEFASWVGTAGPIASSEGFESGRAITVSASPVWSFQDIDVTLEIASVVGSLGILGVWWRPVRQRRT